MRRAANEIPRQALFSGAMVRACLASTFKGHDIAALRQWVRQDLAGRTPLGTTSDRKILILAPSTVFAATWQAATAVWLAGGCPVVKSSQREPCFARLLSESARAVCGSSLPMQVMPPSSRLPVGFRAVIAYGQDRTLALLKKTLPTSRRLIGFGSRFSVALCGRRLSVNAIARVIHQVAWDATLYDTQGCLSPQVCYVEEGGAMPLHVFARRLGEAMQRLDARLPSAVAARESMEEESFHQRWRFLAAEGRARLFSKHVILHSEGGFELAGPRRVVLVTSLRRIRDLPGQLGRERRRLSCIATAGCHPRDMEGLRRNLEPAGVRFCRTGEMHEPPPSWHNGGVNLLRRLTAII
jgi:hypothetical protein